MERDTELEMETVKNLMRFLSDNKVDLQTGTNAMIAALLIVSKDGLDTCISCSPSHHLLIVPRDTETDAIVEMLKGVDLPQA